MLTDTYLKNYSYGIIGGGFIGQVLKKYYPTALVYDINGQFDSKESVLSQNIIFIAFNLADNALAEENYKKIAEYPKQAKEGRIFIIKSTFLPGTTDRLQREFPQHYFVYNCEFLTELTAWEDFTKPQFQILGVPHQSLPLVNDLFNFLPSAPIKRVISPLDAETLKHAMNSYYALKVTWFNQLYDACSKLHADYETVREIMVQNPWVGNSHSIIFFGGYRGYGGKCLSKDPKNMAQLVDFPLINHIEQYNETLKKM